MNVQAWGIWTAMQNPTATAWGLQGDLFRSLTEGWTGDERADCLARLDVIRAFVDETHGDQKHPD